MPETKKPKPTHTSHEQLQRYVIIHTKVEQYTRFLSAITYTLSIFQKQDPQELSESAEYFTTLHETLHEKTMGIIFSLDTFISASDGQDALKPDTNSAEQ